MYCQNCGTAIPADARFCASCGRAVTIAAVPSADSRVARHVRLLAILWIARAALEVMGGLVTIFIGKMFLPFLAGVADGGQIPAFVPALVGAAGWLTLLLAMPSVAVGVGLLNRDSWARPLAIVMGFLALLSPVLGTALGIYTLWVLLPANSDAEYRKLARAA